MPKSVNTERRRDRKPKHTKRAIMDFPKNFSNDGDASLDILNTG